MTEYLLDTSIIIDYLRGKLPVVNFIDSLKGKLSSSYICLAELYEGIYRVKNPQNAENNVITFFEGLDNIYGIDE